MNILLEGLHFFLVREADGNSLCIFLMENIFRTIVVENAKSDTL
jgi:hypothetical protein